MLSNNLLIDYSIISYALPSLILYSHIPIITICILVSFFIIFKKEKKSVDLSLFLISILLGMRIIFSLILWSSNKGNVIMTLWAFSIVIEPLIYTCGLNLAKILIDNKLINLREYYIFAILYTPIIVFLPTKYMLYGFDFSNYTGIEGPMSLYYCYGIQILTVCYMTYYVIKRVYLDKILIGSKTILSVVSLIFFLVSFWLGNLIGSFTGNWVSAEFGLLGIPIFFIIMLYNTTDFRIFNTKISGKNILVVSLWILIASLVLITDLIMSHVVVAITFTVSLIIGIILIKSSEKERIHLEKISSLAASLESLNSTLSEKVEEQTKEIKKSYELERKARRELEKLSETKDKFISIAQHNLRIPITNIKNKINFAISRTATDTDTTTTNILNETNKSIDYLTEIADDFKNIAKLNSNSQILNTSNATLLPILENILRELKIDIENINIEVTYPSHTSDWPELKIDTNRIKEVLMVILENAVRYNFKNGKINIETKTTGDNFEIKIFNTGIGLTLDENKQLFNRSFYRSKIAKELNPIGMGIGLSLSKNIVEAHHGTLEISSGGENMGVTVNVTLPFDFLVKYS